MLQKSNTLKIEELFFVNPNKEYYLMEISRKIKLAHTSVKRNLKDSVKLGLITERIEKRGKRLFPLFKANSNNKAFKRLKTEYNICSILDAGLIEFIEEKLTPKSIVLFGSYSRGEDAEDSDIDLFIECKKESLQLHKFEKKLNRKVELHFNEKFSTYPKELRNNIINGFVLSGFLEAYL